jgi:hypothetical protein
MDLRYVKEQTPEICLAAVQRRASQLGYAHYQTPEICLTAVKKEPWTLQYVKEQTTEICIAAIQNDGWALRHVKKQTHELCLLAVKKDGMLLDFVKDQTPEICLAAVQQNGLALEFVKEHKLNPNSWHLLKEDSGYFQKVKDWFSENFFKSTENIIGGAVDWIKKLGSDLSNAVSSVISKIMEEIKVFWGIIKE